MLFMLRCPPGDSHAVYEQVDQILTAAAFDQAVTVLFLDDGVYQLLPGQAEVDGMVPVSRLLASLALYEVDVLAEVESLVIRGLADRELAITVPLIKRVDLPDFMASFDMILGG